jgi:predicted transcriptional regulator of viral defense system
MKTVVWLHFLSRQQREHAKGIFTCTELANVADGSPGVINVALGRLVRQGHMCRYAPGRYGLPEGVAVEELVASIDPDAYVTGAHALFRHGHITQIPREIDCFTRRPAQKVLMTLTLSNSGWGGI